jgi:hypothetical protein
VQSRRTNGVALTLAALVWFAGTSWAQNATITRNVNLRSEQSTAEPAIRLLTPNEPPLTLLEPLLQDGYYHVRTSAGEEAMCTATTSRSRSGE